MNGTTRSPRNRSVTFPRFYLVFPQRTAALRKRGAVMFDPCCGPKERPLPAPSSPRREHRVVTRGPRPAVLSGPHLLGISGSRFTSLRVTAGRGRGRSVRAPANAGAGGSDAPRRSLRRLHPPMPPHALPSRSEYPRLRKSPGRSFRDRMARDRPSTVPP
jgi:hypothetical protein